jgi:hypothetical protein
MRIQSCFLAVILSALPLSSQAVNAFLPSGYLDASTVPSNGDQNPYGIVFVPAGFPSGGMLTPGDILVSNFNNTGSPPTGNIQGTGTTIVDIQSGVQGDMFTFFTGFIHFPTDGGFTTALGILKKGFVVVGQLPNDGSGNGGYGSLLFINKMGIVVLEYLGAAVPALMGLGT